MAQLVWYFSPTELETRMLQWRMEQAATGSSAWTYSWMLPLVGRAVPIVWINHGHLLLRIRWLDLWWKLYMRWVVRTLRLMLWWLAQVLFLTINLEWSFTFECTAFEVWFVKRMRDQKISSFGLLCIAYPLRLAFGLSAWIFLHGWVTASFSVTPSPFSALLTFFRPLYDSLM